jgi:hypothetical protein
MPAIHFDYVIGSAAVDIFILLTIAIGIIAEMHHNRPPHQRTADKDRQLRDRHQTLTIDDRTWREPAGVNVINYGVKL